MGAYRRVYGLQFTVYWRGDYFLTEEQNFEKTQACFYVFMFFYVKKNPTEEQKDKILRVHKPVFYVLMFFCQEIKIMGWRL